MHGKYLKLLTQQIDLGLYFLPFAITNRCPTPKRLYRARTLFLYNALDIQQGSTVNGVEADYIDNGALDPGYLNGIE